MAISGDFYDALSLDAPLVALLSTYRTNPAVFTGRVPEDAALPYVVTAGEIAHEPFDDKLEAADSGAGWSSPAGVRGRQIERQVECYAANDGSVLAVEAIAEAVRAIFHRQTIAIAGFGTVQSIVSGPIAIDDEEAVGRVLTVRMILQKV